MPSQSRGSSSAGPAPRPRFLRRRFLITVAVLLAFAALLGSASAYFLNQDLPNVRALEDYRPATISRLLAADGTVIHQFATERRIVIPYEAIATTLRDAVVAVEDSNFFSHVGVDPVGILRALVHDIRAMKIKQGGSTITQQLALGLFLKREMTLTRKIREAILATHVEATYTKEEILAFYCNQVYMGHGYYGVEAASLYYFGKRAAELSIPEAALLAGLIQRPEALSPHRHPERALSRRNHVLDRMLEEGFLDPASHAQAREAPIEVRPPRPPVSVADYFVEEIRRALDNRYGADALYRSGFTIETGLDLDLQRETEAALQRGVREVAKRQGFVPPGTNILDEERASLEEYTHGTWHLPLGAGRIVTGLVMEVEAKSARIRIAESEFEIGLEAVEWTKLEAMDEVLRAGDLVPFLVVDKEDGSLRLELSAEPTANGAAVAMDPATGEIKAMVGGLDFGTSQFNRAVQARRQPGSSFKPILYSAALEEGWKATDVLMDEPTVFEDPRTGVPYQPENYYKDYRGIVTIRHALEESLNIPTVRLLNMVGYRRVVEQARRMGLTSPLQPYPAMALGASEVTLLELVATYATLANLGTRVEPRLYTRLTSYADGRTEEILPRASDALRPEVAYQVTSLLKGVIARGTAKKALGMGDGVAGKTGTTDDNTDAWFIGYSPSLVLGVWVGRDEKESLGNTETGPRAALPIWMEVMSTYLAGRPPETFRRPPGIETVAVDPATGLRAGIRTGCERVILEEYRRDEGPPPLCSDHAHRRVSLPYYMQRYPWLDERTLVLTDADLSRLVREAGHDMLVDPEQKIIVPAGGRLDVLPFVIVAPDHPILSGLAGSAALVAGGSAAVGPGRAVSSGMDLLYPPDLVPLNGTAAEPPILGIDGRTAAVVPIRYP